MCSRRKTSGFTVAVMGPVGGDVASIAAEKWGILADVAGLIVMRSLVARAKTTTQATFSKDLGELVLVGASAPETEQDPAWAYATHAGIDITDGNPFTTLINSVAAGLQKKSSRSAFGDTILVGRSESNDIWIEDASVSKLHARIKVEGYLLSDARSTNGTFIDGRRLQVDETVSLRSNLRVRFGDRRFQIYKSSSLHRILSNLTL